MAKTPTKPAGSEQQAAAEFTVDIAAPGGARRRAGLEFGPVARTIPVAELSEEQIKAIEEDPMLTIRRTPVKAAPEDEPPAA